MIVELGHFALILALAAALLQGSLPMIGAARGDAAWMAVARPAAFAQLVLIVIAFGALTHAYVTSDFSVFNVVQNSHSATQIGRTSCSERACQSVYISEVADSLKKK